MLGRSTSARSFLYALLDRCENDPPLACFVRSRPHTTTPLSPFCELRTMLCLSRYSCAVPTLAQCNAMPFSNRSMYVRHNKSASSQFHACPGANPANRPSPRRLCLVCDGRTPSSRLQAKCNPCRSSMSFPLLAFIINGGPLSSATRLPIVQCSPPLVPLVYPRPKAAS